MATHPLLVVTHLWLCCGVVRTMVAVAFWIAAVGSTGTLECRLVRGLLYGLRHRRQRCRERLCYICGFEDFDPHAGSGGCSYIRGSLLLCWSLTSCFRQILPFLPASLRTLAALINCFDSLDVCWACSAITFLKDNVNWVAAPAPRNCMSACV